MQKRLFSRALTDPASPVELIMSRLRVSAAEARARVSAGSVYADGRRLDEDSLVAIGAKVVVFVSTGTPCLPIVITYEDASIVIVEKPPGVPCQAERSQETGALDVQVRRRFPTARLLHRLDKSASGLVAFARGERACVALQRALSVGRIERRYLAIVAGELTGEGTIRLRIGRHRHDQRLRRALPENASEGAHACSHYRALASGRLDSGSGTLVDLRLETGRTHQLRVHLSSLGHPILGDSAYGGPSFSRLCLHAYALALPHPLDDHLVEVRARIPEEFVGVMPEMKHWPI